MAHGGLALDGDIGGAVLDIEHRLRRVLHAPDDDGTDLDGVAALVIHLEPFGVQVARTQGDSAAGVERIRPVEAGIPLRAAVVAEEEEHGGFVRLQREEAAHENHDEDEEQDAAECRADGGVPGGDDADEPRDGADERGDECREHGPSTEGGDAALGTGGTLGVHVQGLV